MFEFEIFVNCQQFSFQYVVHGGALVWFFGHHLEVCLVDVCVVVVLYVLHFTCLSFCYTSLLHKLRHISLKIVVYNRLNNLLMLLLVWLIRVSCHELISKKEGRVVVSLRNTKFNLKVYVTLVI